MLADELGDKGADGGGLAVLAVVDRSAQKAVLVDGGAGLDDLVRVQRPELAHALGVHGRCVRGGVGDASPRDVGIYAVAAAVHTTLRLSAP